VGGWGRGGGEAREDSLSKRDQTCVSPLVSLELVRAREPAAAVCELTLVGFLPWTKTIEKTQSVKCSHIEHDRIIDFPDTDRNIHQQEHLVSNVGSF